MHRFRASRLCKQWRLLWRMLSI
ncbi:hypothetical protein ACIQ1D_05845 [Lysinibacillus xylanilyticus]